MTDANTTKSDREERRKRKRIRWCGGENGYIICICSKFKIVNLKLKQWIYCQNNSNNKSYQNRI
jgi:hypothetical protein